MKNLLVFSLFLAVSLAFPTPFGLKEDLDDFVALIPRTEVLNIFTDYLANDEEVQEVANYVLSDDFTQLILDIESIPEQKQFLAFLQENGLNVYYYINKLHEFLGLPEFIPRSRGSGRGTGVRGMLDDIEAILPIEEFQEMYYYKLKNSPAFANLIERLHGKDFEVILNKLLKNERFQELVNVAKEHGVDFQVVREILKLIFGWDFP